MSSSRRPLAGASPLTAEELAAQFSSTRKILKAHSGGSGAGVLKNQQTKPIRRTGPPGTQQPKKGGRESLHSTLGTSQQQQLEATQEDAAGSAGVVALSGPAALNGAQGLKSADEPIMTDKQSLCIDILVAGHVNSFVDFFYLTHRAEEDHGAGGASSSSSASHPPPIPDSKLNGIKSHLTAAERAHRRGDSEQVYESYESLAHDFHATQDYKTSIYFYERCLDLAESMEDLAQQCNSNLNLGLTHDAMGDTAAAIRFHEKCFGAGTEILMYDGTAKLIEDLTTRDVLMGDDSTPRRIHSTTVGHTANDVDNQMFQVTGGGGDEWQCNADHILVVRVPKPTIEMATSTHDDHHQQQQQQQQQQQSWRLGKCWSFDPIESSSPAVQLESSSPEYTPSGATRHLRSSSQYFSSFASASAALARVTDADLTLELTVREYFAMAPADRADLRMYQPSEIVFAPLAAKSTLASRAAAAFGRELTAEQVGDVAWAIGMCLASASGGVHAQAQSPEVAAKWLAVHAIASASTTSEIPSASNEGAPSDAVRALMNSYAAADTTTTAGQKHIARDLLTETKEVRAAILVGIIDAASVHTGHDDELHLRLPGASSANDLNQQQQKLVDDVLHLCHGLGLRTAKQMVADDESCCLVRLTGANLRAIPSVRAGHGQPSVAVDASLPLSYDASLCHRFHLESIGHAKYYGVQVDGNQRLLLARGFTVVHNSKEIAAAMGAQSRIQTANQQLVEAYRRYAEEHERKDDNATAVLLYKRCLAAAQESNDLRSEGLATYRLGVACAAMGEKNESIEFQQKYLHICKRIGDQLGEGAACAALAHSFKEMGQTDLAKSYLERYQSIAQRNKQSVAQAEACAALGSIHSAEGDHQLAVAFFEKTFDIARTVGDRKLIDSARINLGMARGNRQLGAFMHTVSSNLPELLAWKQRRQAPSVRKPPA